MKTLNLISTRWVLIMAFALIGSAALFTACEQESMDDLAPLETAIDSSVDDRSGYQFLRTETARDLKDWKKVFEGNKAELKDKDIKLEIMPSQAVTTINVNARWSGRLITQFKNTRAWQTRVVEVLANQLTGSETHIDVHSWSSVKTTYYVKVYVRDSNGGGNPPPTGSSFNCSHNPLAFPGSFTIGIEGAQPVNNNNGSNNMTITTQVEGKNRYQHIDESGANFVRLNFFRPNNFSQNDYSWLNTYDNIVCEFASRGIAIYGLVTDVVAGDGGPDNYPTSNPGAQDQWIRDYVDAFEVIVKRYKGYINVYESFNEPNVWVAHNTPKMSEAKFASLLQQTYSRIKPSGSNPHNVKLISGPLEAHDGYSPDPAPNSGDFGGAGQYFQNVLNNLNGFPFDGIGYHIYARKYGGGQWDLEGTIHKVLEGIWSVTNSVPWNKRQLYISEVGWNAESMGNRIQGNINDKEEAHANFMTRGLEKLKQNSWRIKAVSFFSIESFNNGEGGHSFLAEDFGLIRPFDIIENGVFLLPAGKKHKCWCVFQKMARDGKNAATARNECGVSSY